MSPAVVFYGVPRSFGVLRRTLHGSGHSAAFSISTFKILPH